MNVRALAMTVLAGTLTLLAWQTLSHAVLPSPADAAAALGPTLVKQLVLDVIAVALLTVLSGFLVDRSALGVAKAAGAVGFVMLLLHETSNVIWFGFTASRAAMNIVDQSVSLFVTGLVMGAVLQKLDPQSGVAVPYGQGYRTSGGRKTVAR